MILSCKRKLVTRVIMIINILDLTLPKIILQIELVMQAYYPYCNKQRRNTKFKKKHEPVIYCISNDIRDRESKYIIHTSLINNIYIILYLN